MKKDRLIIECDDCGGQLFIWKGHNKAYCTKERQEKDSDYIQQIIANFDAHYQVEMEELETGRMIINYKGWC